MMRVGGGAPGAAQRRCSDPSGLSSLCPVGYYGSMSRSVSVAVDHDPLFSQIAEAVRLHAKGVTKALLFGSFARGEAKNASDIDILLVWPADVDEDSQWDEAIEMAHRVDKITNRVCLPLMYTEDEYRQLPQRYPQLAENIARDSIDLLKS